MGNRRIFPSILFAFAMLSLIGTFYFLYNFTDLIFNTNTLNANYGYFVVISAILFCATFTTYFLIE